MSLSEWLVVALDQRSLRLQPIRERDERVSGRLASVASLHLDALQRQLNAASLVSETD